MKLISPPYFIVILSLFGNDIAHGIENEDAKTVIVPIKEKENVESRYETQSRRRINVRGDEAFEESHRLRENRWDLIKKTFSY